MRGLDLDDPRGLSEVNARLESSSPEERLAFAVESFGTKLLFTSSFGAGSGVLLHLWSRIAGKLPVVCIDTGFLFEETVRYRNLLVDQLGLNLVVVHPKVARADFVAEYGDSIQRTDPDFCCGRNKVDPIAPLKTGAEAWVSGLRRDQGESRAHVPILLAADGEPLKVHPLATMTSREADAYMSANGVPEHPMKARGFRSIGCEPCTRAVADGEDERAGRWSWAGKTECGLHERALRNGTSPSTLHSLGRRGTAG